MSGLSRTPGKRVWVYPHRGFESRLLRQLKNKAVWFHPKQPFFLPYPQRGNSRQCDGVV